MVKRIADGDYLVANDINQLLQAGEQNGVISGLEVIENSPAAMSVVVSAGEAYVSGNRIKITSTQTVTITAADASLDRIDVITLDIDGTAAVVTGSPLSTPIPPAYSSEKIVLAFITVVAADTTIDTADISDERIMVKHQLYKRPWLSEVECGGDVYLFDTNNTATEADWTRVVDTDYTLSSTGEFAIQNGLLKIVTRVHQGANRGEQTFYVVEDLDYNADNVSDLTSNYLTLSHILYVDTVLWDISNVIPTITLVEITPNKVELKLRYSDSSRVLDVYITLEKGQRYAKVNYNLISLAGGDTALDGVYCKIKDPTGDTIFVYRDISTGGKFRLSEVEAADLTGDGDDLSKNYQMAWAKTSTNPFIFGYATDKMPSHATEGANADWNAYEYIGLLGREDVSKTSGDLGINFYPFALPFKDLDKLVKEAEVSTGEFGRTDIQGTWVTVVDNTNCSGSNYLTNADESGGSGAQNDEVRYDFYVPKTGFYDIWLHAARNRDSGIVTVELDGASQGTIDLYVNPGTDWIYDSVENISMTKGRHDIDLNIATKNGSSADYEALLDFICIVPKYEQTNYGGDFPYDIARQAISNNEFNFGYASPLNYVGVYGTGRVTNDWNFEPSEYLDLPVGTISSSETIDFHRYARKRYIDDVGTLNAADNSFTSVTGTWSVYTACNEDTNDSLLCPSNTGEVYWSHTFPRSGWYVFEAHVKESEDGTDDHYIYSVKNRTLSDSYTALDLDHYQDQDTGTASVRWSKGYANIFAERGAQDLQMKVTGDNNGLIDFLKIFPLDPIPMIINPSSDDITFATNRVSDVPHSRIDGINQMDSVQADYGNFVYIDMDGDVDMNQSELKEAVIENLAVAPSSPVAGQIYFDTAGSQFLGWTGSGWTVLG